MKLSVDFEWIVLWVWAAEEWFIAMITSPIFYGTRICKVLLKHPLWLNG